MKEQRSDHYAVLDIARDATPEEITHAYRMLLRRHHPDTRGHDEATAANSADAELQRVISAYTVLRDPEARTRYDQQNAPLTPAPRQPRQHPTVRPPIIAGPVRWHPSTTTVRAPRS